MTHFCQNIPEIILYHTLLYYNIVSIKINIYRIKISLETFLIYFIIKTFYSTKIIKFLN